VSRAGTGEDRLAAVHRQLTDAVAALSSSQGWQAMLTAAARLHRYSPNNVLLIAAQRPDATQVAGYTAWKQLGRAVRKGERGIASLAPVLRRPATADPDPAGAAPTPADGEHTPPARTVTGFRVAYVFDISQTDGPDTSPLRPALLAGAAPLRLWADLLDQVDAAGYRLGHGDLAPANGRTDFTAHTVTLHRDLPAAQQTKTLAHELAHIRLHAPDVRPAGLTREAAEVEAESVAYVVTAAHGLPAGAYSVPYLAGWAGGDLELLAASATRVLSAARTILHRNDPTAPDPAPPAADRARQHPPPPYLQPAAPARVMQR
jgi:hypothetical protein